MKVECEDYDPSRVMSSGETVYQALERLGSHSMELKHQAKSQVNKLIRGKGYMSLYFRLKRKPTAEELAAGCVRMTMVEAEDEVYCRRFGPDRFPVKGKSFKFPSLEERLRAGG